MNALSLLRSLARRGFHLTVRGRAIYVDPATLDDKTARAIWEARGSVIALLTEHGGMPGFTLDGRRRRPIRPASLALLHAGAVVAAAKAEALCNGVSP